jgi:MoxR-like ATPase
VLGEIRPLLDVARLDAAQRELDATVAPVEVVRYIVGIIRNTRELPGVVLGASPRASIHMLNAAKAQARLSGREVPTREDVTAMAPYVLPHRIMVQSGVSPTEIIAAAVDAAR